MSDLELGPIGQISREVGDLEAAVAWYRDVLRIEHLYSFPNLAFFDCGGTRLFLTHHDDGNDAGHLILYFRVDDIASAYEELAGRGVSFRGAPQLIHRHEDGTEEWMAFFEDPDGELLALMSQVSPK